MDKIYNLIQCLKRMKYDGHEIPAEIIIMLIIYHEKDINTETILKALINLYSGSKIQSALTTLRRRGLIDKTYLTPEGIKQVKLWLNLIE